MAVAEVAVVVAVASTHEVVDIAVDIAVEAEAMRLTERNESQPCGVRVQTPFCTDMAWASG